MTWKLLGGDPLKEVFLGSFWTHHSLVVDLNHLVACVDLLTLVGWRLQRHRETGRQEEQRQRSESHWRAWSVSAGLPHRSNSGDHGERLESGGENTERDFAKLSERTNQICHC